MSGSRQRPKSSATLSWGGRRASGSQRLCRLRITAPIPIRHLSPMVQPWSTARWPTVHCRCDVAPLDRCARRRAVLHVRPVADHDRLVVSARTSPMRASVRAFRDGGFHVDSCPCRQGCLATEGSDMNDENGKYILATDTSAQKRLRLLQSVYGPSTEALLNSIGIDAGMRAVDFGCGIGSVTQTLALLVAPNGHATGVDMSQEHLATAAKDASASRVTNISWQEGSAYDTKLPRAAFDVAYCRFLLEHLTDPFAALNEMHALLKPGG